jgi:hypothetical protein
MLPQLWKMVFGLRHKGVLIVLGFAALREGKILRVQAQDKEGSHPYHI